MEKLGRIRIEGFRSIRSLNLELGDLTVLIGANGSGKSNFIGFFEMLGFMLGERLQVYVGRKGGGSSILHYGPKTTPAMEADLELVGTSRVDNFSFTLAFAAPDKLQFTREYIDAGPFASSLYSVESLGAGHFETKLIDASKASEPSEAREAARVFVRWLRDLRVYHFYDTSEAAPIRVLQPLHRNRELLGDGANLAAFLYMLKETRSQCFDRISSLVRLAVPYVKELILEPDRLDPKKILLRFRDNDPDYEFGPHQLSDGSLRAIAIITALVQPEDTLPSVIFLDEPELGLHPSAIGLIADLVQEVSSRRQVVVATQSPRFLLKFSPEQVVVVERSEDQQGRGESTYRRLSTDELSAWLEDYDLGELFEKNVTGGWPQ